MNEKAKRVIKGVAKTTGKWTLKGVGKGIELAGRGSLGIVNSVIKNKHVQKIASTTGIIAASVSMPAVGIGVLGIIGAKYAKDKFKGNNKKIYDEVKDIFKAGNTFTKNMIDIVVSPVLESTKEGFKEAGKNYQENVNDFFK